MGYRRDTGFWRLDLVEGNYLEDQSIDARLILKLTCKNGIRKHNWIELAQDRDRWRAVVNAVMNFQVP